MRGERYDVETGLEVVRSKDPHFSSSRSIEEAEIRFVSLWLRLYCICVYVHPRDTRSLVNS